MTINRYVWVLTQEVPYEGTVILGVYSPDQTRRVRAEHAEVWNKTSPTSWASRTDNHWDPYLLLERFEVNKP